MAAEKETPDRSPKRYVPFRISLQTIRAIDFLSAQTGQNRTVIVEMAVQEWAEKKGYKGAQS